VIDEVLAVGDAEFQKKAIGKMQDISKGEGRTVLFVSHSMAAVKSLCTRAIVLEHGTSVFEGGTDEAVSYYLRNKEENVTINFPIAFEKGQILDFKVLDFIGNNSNLLLGEKCTFDLKLAIEKPQSIKINIRYQLFDKDEELITTFNTYHHDANKILDTEVQNFICTIGKLNVSPGAYDIALQVLDLNTRKILYQSDCLSEIVIETGDVFKTGKLPSRENLGVFLSEQSWEIS
jgi:lipopolysaccharide transport system ATP-binding protein